MLHTLDVYEFRPALFSLSLSYLSQMTNLLGLLVFRKTQTPANADTAGASGGRVSAATDSRRQEGVGSAADQLVVNGKVDALGLQAASSLRECM